MQELSQKLDRALMRKLKQESGPVRSALPQWVLFCRWPASCAATHAAVFPRSACVWHPGRRPWPRPLPTAVGHQALVHRCKSAPFSDVVSRAWPTTWRRRCSGRNLVLLSLVPRPPSRGHGRPCPVRGHVPSRRHNSDVCRPRRGRPRRGQPRRGRRLKQEVVQEH